MVLSIMPNLSMKKINNYKAVKNKTKNFNTAIIFKKPK